MSIDRKKGLAFNNNVSSWGALAIMVAELLACTKPNVDHSGPHSQTPAATITSDNVPPAVSTPPSSTPQTVGEPTPPIKLPLSGCPTHLSTPQGAQPVVPWITGSNLRQTLDDAKNGKITRVRMEVHNPWAQYEYPCFSISRFEEVPRFDIAFLDGAPLFYAVFVKPAVNGYRYKDIVSYGSGRYEFTGYFTGRSIDAFEWSREQYGKVLLVESLGDVEIPLSSTYPEFCVEKWCVVPDPNRERWPAASGPEKAQFAREYKRILKNMQLDGVPVCPAHKP